MEIPRRESDSRKRKKMIEMKKKMSNLTREQLKAAIEKKRICNAKAMTVVERLIEPDVEEIWFLESLFNINQSHYQDAVEERAIMKYCGYPLCDAPLDEVPRKQYHISTKQNKVFDITDRKHYCSNVCYKASVYLKEQLYTSPLWLRDCEDCVQYKLFSAVNKTGSTGVEVDLGNVSPVKSDEDFDYKLGENDENEEMNISSSIDTTLFCSVERPEQANHEDDTCANSILSETQIKKQKIIDESESAEPVAINKYVLESNRCNNHRLVEEKSKQKVQEKPGINEYKIKSKKERRLLSVGDKVSVFLDSWFTADSMRFLYGDVKMKEILEEFGTPAERFGQLINTKDAFLYERYTELCKRLNLIELKEKIEEKEDRMPTKPLPDYEVLKVEARELEIKVRSFYLGDKKVCFQDTLEESEEHETKNKEQTGPDVNSTPPPVLPLVDKHCVLATRRRIVLDKLYKTIPDIQSALGLAQFNTRHEIQEFVHTLALSASNITLSPSEWNLLSIVIIKLFTLRNELLDYAFNTDLTQKRIINLLLAYRLDLDYLQKCVKKLANVEQIIKNSQ